MEKRTYPCCECCPNDVPHIEKDTHEIPCDICARKPYLAEAWLAGARFARKNFRMSEEAIKEANPYVEEKAKKFSGKENPYVCPNCKQLEHVGSCGQGYRVTRRARDWQINH